MTTFTIGEHSSSSTEDTLIPVLLSSHTKPLLGEETASINSGLVQLLRDVYGDLDTTTSSQAILENYEAELTKVKRQEVQPRELDDFKTINRFADKLLDGIEEEPLDAQKQTYDKFWDLF